MTLLGDALTKNQRIVLETYKERTQWAVQRFLSNRMAAIALLIVLGTLFMAIFAPFLAPYEPQANIADAQGEYSMLEPPSSEHIMGTNHHSQDILSQWIYGSRVSLLVAFLSGIAVMLIGTTVGLVSGYYKGTVDLVLMRVVDILYAIPAIPLLLVVSLLFGSSVWNVIIAMILILWRTMARVVRSQTLSLSERPFVKAAKASGASDLRIMYVHIAPNLLPIILIEGVFVMGAAILLEAGISFLGLGTTEMISWGVMLQLTYTSGAITHAWWWVLPPGISITVLVVAFFYMSRGIEEITNPELQHR
ncbi:ABC transporter permease [Natrarchaeobius halalkaliphilus]|uniref:ABC transporter permease n=1 Tax=Natrarchaeobius halalkaliphilus TaxID=1679091 RepID=A0A3N6LNQ2_9EURY|nr:ABC transporter permease [Natrarchaeobius halalkaliphilus]RQG87807.1 ABC transporter permease [Natrarchaeobius halalkaliphilus]